jgi:hypothetical protein
MRCGARGWNCLRRSPRGLNTLPRTVWTGKIGFLTGYPERTAPDAYIAVLAQCSFTGARRFRAKLMEAKCYQDVFEAIAEDNLARRLTLAIRRCV